LRGGGGGRRGIAELRALVRQHTKAAVDQLVELMQRSDSDRVKRESAEALLDRAWGKPTTMVGGDGDNPIRIDVAAEDLLAKLERLGLEKPREPDE
jgi:hypothetical protein